jgi:hypothetical protein
MLDERGDVVAAPVRRRPGRRRVREPDVLPPGSGGSSVGFTPPTYNSGWSSGHPIPDVIKIQSAVRRLTRPSQAGVTTTTRSDPDGNGGTTATTPPPTTITSGSSSKRRPACATAG